MSESSFLSAFPAVAAQQNPASIFDLAYYVAAAMAVLILGFVVIMVVRRLMRNRGEFMRSEGLDLGTVSEMGRKGLLTPEELRLVRQAVVRQTMRSAGSAESEGEADTGVADLAVKESTRQAAAPSPAGIEAPLTPRPAKPAPAAPAGKRLDMEKLLEKGLITQAEYDRLKQHFGE